MSAVASLVQADNRRRQLVEAALAPDVLIGMPHLTPFGLSETWLLKELAHRHWLMLGRALGLADADFRLPDGREAYAAICASGLYNAKLVGIAANDILTIRSRLTPVARARIASRHRLGLEGRPVGEVELISAFVHRSQNGSNDSIARVRLSGLDLDLSGQVEEDSPLVTRLTRLRRGEYGQAGLSVPTAPVLRTYEFAPSQMQEFNGAGLFYFANFQAVIDRAIEGWFGRADSISNRRTFFVGNIDARESVSVKLLAGQGVQLLLERGNGQIIAHQAADYTV